MSNTLENQFARADVQEVGMPQKTLTTWKIVVLILAALTPLSVVMATLPLGLAFGGPSSALTYLLAGSIIGLFCIGYAEMVRQISRPGAFYSYICRGISKPFGVGAAMIAVVGYVSGCLGSFAVGSAVIGETVTSLGFNLSWQTSLVGLVIFVAVMVWNQIDFSAFIGGLIVICELLLIAALLIGIINLHGIQATFSSEVIQWNIFQYGNWHVAFIFSFLVFQGLEAGALYAPETRNPEKMIPRALAISVTILSLTFFLVSWALISFSSPATLMDQVISQHIFGFIIAIIQASLGETGLFLFGVVTVLGVMICTLAVVNFMARYLNGLAGDKILPRYLATLNRNGAPSNAAFTLIAVSCIVIIFSVSCGISPYSQLSPLGFGVAAISGTSLLILSSLAVVGYFMRSKKSQGHWWKTFLAPIFSIILLVMAMYIELKGFNFITGMEAAWTNYLPLLVLFAFVFGFFYALFLKKNKSSIYHHIAAGDNMEEVIRIREENREV